MASAGNDQELRFTIPERNARGRLIRLGPLLDEILAAHDYPSSVRHLLAEALAITALLGSLLKGDAQLTFQASAPAGVVDLLVCDYANGALRGYLRHDAERLVRLGSNPSLDQLFGEGYLAITFELVSSGERYQGIVPLQGASLAEVCEGYFAQSEQVPTLIRVAARHEDGRCVAGGLLIQHLPEGEEGGERLHVRAEPPEWEHVSTLGSSVRHQELVDPALPLEDLLWRLYHEEARVLVEPVQPLRKGCRCTVEHFAAVLSRFAIGERKEMADEHGVIGVDCEFCSRKFALVGLVES